MIDFKKRAGSMLIAMGGLSALALAASPATALAAGTVGWDANTMLSSTNTAGVEMANLNQQSFAAFVQSLTTFLFGLAIVAVVLRIVLTAIDRLVFSPDSGGGRGGMGGRPGGGGETTGGVLSQIPVIGAYPPSMGWKDILVNVLKNVAIVAGAWVLVNVIVGVVQLIFTQIH